MLDIRTPKVYIVEKQSFPNSIQQVESAVPVFVGYTQKKGGETLELTTWEDFKLNFGGPNGVKASDFGLTYIVSDKKVETVIDKDKVKAKPTFYLYYAMQHYFQNGGGRCFVVSCGDYSIAVSKSAIDAGLSKAIDIEDATIVVAPELSLLAKIPTTGTKKIDYSDIDSIVIPKITKLINDNKYEKFFILDIVDGMDTVNEDKEQFDESNFSGFSIAKEGEFMAFYYPNLITSMKVEIDETVFTEDLDYDEKATATAAPTAKKILKATTDNKEKILRHIFKQKVEEQLPNVILPPSAAMAGVYAKTDNLRGVWKTPANEAISGIKQLTKKVDDLLHADLNVDSQTQRSICAIRTLPGYGTRVMGGRTLNGGSADFRYISVRRYISITEKSIKNALFRYLFEPNNSTTWSLVKIAISNYLTRQWEEGALLGGKPEDSFYINIGLKTTMSEQDILDGRMRVEVGMAVVRPAEFIIMEIVQFINKRS
jgi:uncharacterized protein